MILYPIDFHNRTVSKHVSICSRFEPPMAPNLQVFQMTAMDAFPMAIVGFAVAYAVAKVYSVKHDYLIDGNQVSSTLPTRNST